MPSQISLKIWARRAARATSMFSSAAASRLVRTDRAVCRAENWVMKTSARIQWKSVLGKESTVWPSPPPWILAICSIFLEVIKWISDCGVLSPLLKETSGNTEFTTETEAARSSLWSQTKRCVVQRLPACAQNESVFEFWLHYFLAPWSWARYSCSLRLSFLTAEAGEW